MNIFVPGLTDHPPQFWLALALGLITTLFFAISEFEKGTPDLPEEFRPAELTTRHQYLTSFVLYVAGLEVLYVMVCLLGTGPFAEVIAAGSGEAVSDPSFPLWVAVVLIGIVPRVPFLDYLEMSWRRLMHRRAAIPGEALQIVRALRHLPLQRAAACERIARAPEIARGTVVVDDVHAAPETATCAWARLSVLVGRVQSLETDLRADDHLDVAFLDRHVGERARILGEYEKLVRAVASARGCPIEPSSATAGVQPAPASDERAPAELAAVPEGHANEIGRLLERIYLFFGCALVARDPKPAALAEATLFLGFVPEEVEDWSHETDHALKAVTLSVVIVFVLVFAAPYLAAFLPTDFLEGWPTDSRMAIPYAFTALLSYGTAIFLALRLRRARLHERRWFRGPTTRPEIPMAGEYIRVAVLAFAGAVFVLYVYQAMDQASTTGTGAEQVASADPAPPTSPLAGDPGLRPETEGAQDVTTAVERRGGSGVVRFFENLKLLAPFAITPAVAALFVCLLLDGAFLHRPRRWVIGCVVGQIAASAAIAGIAAHLQDLEYLAIAVRVPEFDYVSQAGNTLFAALAAGTFALTTGASTARLSRAAQRRLTVELEEEEHAYSALRPATRNATPERPRPVPVGVAAQPSGGSVMRQDLREEKRA